MQLRGNKDVVLVLNLNDYSTNYSASHTTAQAVKQVARKKYGQSGNDAADKKSHFPSADHQCTKKKLHKKHIKWNTNPKRIEKFI